MYNHIINKGSIVYSAQSLKSKYYEKLENEYNYKYDKIYISLLKDLSNYLNAYQKLLNQTSRTDLLSSIPLHKISCIRVDIYDIKKHSSSIDIFIEPQVKYDNHASVLVKMDRFFAYKELSEHEFIQYVLFASR